MVMNIAAWRWQAGEDLLAVLLLGGRGLLLVGRGGDDVYDHSDEVGGKGGLIG